MEVMFMEALRYAAFVYLAGWGLHNADHFRRWLGDQTDPALMLGHLRPWVFWLGLLSAVLALFTVGVILARHPDAPRIAAVLAPPVAIGVAAVHLPPDWGPLSDPFTGGAALGVNALSWAAVLLEIAGAAAVGVVAIHLLRSARQGVLPRRTEHSPA